MKSTFYSAILALALSVSAAPVEKRTTADKAVDSTSPHVSGAKPPSDEYGPPTFFMDDPSSYKPAHDEDIRESSPSAKPPGAIYPIPGNSTISVNSTIPGNSTTTSTPAITTSTSQRLDKRFRAASRVVTPNVNNYISKAGTLMFGMQNPVCSDVTLIFARGTTEVGNMGTCVGPELAEALRKEIPSLSVQGVDYPANSEGNTRYGASGGPYMVRTYPFSRSIHAISNPELPGHARPRSPPPMPRHQNRPRRLLARRALHPRRARKERAPGLRQRDRSRRRFRRPAQRRERIQARRSPEGAAGLRRFGR
jgi:hypothetical protein